MKTWKLDTICSTLSFSVKHMFVSKVRGTFTCWTGSLDFEPSRAGAASAMACIDAASIDTGESERDAHVRSADFLNVEKYPFIFFRSTRVDPVEGRISRLSGELTLRGVTREVTLFAEHCGSLIDPNGQRRVGFCVRGVISCKTFGIVLDDLLDRGRVALDDELDLLIEVEAVLDVGETLVPRARAVG